MLMIQYNLKKKKCLKQKKKKKNFYLHYLQTSLSDRSLPII